MAGNYHASGSTDATLNFDRPIMHLNITVNTGVTFTISLDQNEHQLTLPAGFHSFPVNPVTVVSISSSGAWSLVALQG